MLLMALLVVACSNTEGRDTAVVVFAAASLGNAMTEIADQFEQANPTVEVRVNIAGSSALREQILEGAPADVFASASTQITEEVARAGEAVWTRPFVTNRMQIGVPSGNPASVASLEDLANEDLFIGQCADGVPCGDAAAAVFTAAGVAASIDTTEPDVRAVTTKLAAGELDAAIIYRSDVIGNDDVDGVDIDPAINVAPLYPIALLTRGDSPVEAERFIEFVMSDAGDEVFVRYGFEPIEDGR